MKLTVTRRNVSDNARAKRGPRESAQRCGE
jgi:hypothetical protein